MDDSKISVGIDGAEIDKIINEINDYIIKLKPMFEKIDNIMLGTKEYYKCTSADILRKKYDLFKDDFNTIIANLMSYQTDLTNLKSKYKSNISTVSDQIRVDTTNILDNKW